MLRIARIIHESNSPAGRAFDLCVQALIILSMVTLALESLPDLPVAWYRWLRTFELLTVGWFSVEYLLRLTTADRPVGYATSFFGIVDFLAIMPSLVGLGFDLRAVRALRLLRIFRLLKLARYSAAVQRYHLALKIAWEELVLFGTLAAILLFLAAVGIHHFENEAQPEVFSSIPHSLWWAVVSLTTVGYGDAFPVTAGGKLFTGVILIVGLGVVSVPCGLVASALSAARDMQEELVSRSREPEDQS